MRIKTILGSVSAITLAAAPVAAAASAPATPVSAQARASADSDGASALAGGGGFTAVIAFAVIVGGLVALLASEDFGDEPNSP